MKQRKRILLSSLALGLAASTGLMAQLVPVPVAQRVQLATRQPQRLQRLHDDLLSRLPDYGLGVEHRLRPKMAETDIYGKTIVRFAQEYRGIPVWGGQAITSLDAQDRIEPVVKNLLPVTALSVQAEIPLDQAIQLAMDDLKLGKTNTRMRPSAELVVFPTRYQEGLKFVYDRNTQTTKLDPVFSVTTDRCDEPYRLAYHVRTAACDPKRGVWYIEYMIDARTGAILKKWNGAHHASEPVKVTGHSQYSGDVQLDALQLDDGRYLLKDGTGRATRQSPLANAVVTPILELASPGILVLTDEESPQAYYSDTPVFGDGANYTFGDIAHLLDANGQTAAVDAYYGVTSAWDFYSTLFGRNSFDKQGTSVTIFVHMYAGSPYDNAVTISDLQMIQFGDGDLLNTMTSLDVVAHECGHLVMSASLPTLDKRGESGGLSEANADILGALVEFWARGLRSASIPDAGGNWTIGEQTEKDLANPYFMRCLYRPSLHNSYDAWFDGIGLDEIHFNNGPLLRFFYFLSQGTGEGDYASDYLPNGMQGIGNDKAGRIWYRGIDRYLAKPDNRFTDVRVATLNAAEDLYTKFGEEYQAVLNAWKAVNLDPKSIRVRFPESESFRNVIFVPMRLSSQLKVNVENAKDSDAVGWIGGGFGHYYASPFLSTDGLYTSPDLSGVASVVTVYSLEDTSQYATGLVATYDLDADMDLETDACDLGAMALSWQVDGLFPGADLYPDGTTDAFDARIWLDAFKAGYGQ